MTQLSERRITNGDFKRIYLPIGDWEIEPPETGIYEEPVVYYKANYKWAALIEGYVSWLTEITAWKNAEDENYSGIQAIMTFLERIVIEIDCAQIEDCLETSTIINQMITNITQNTTNITIVQGELDEVVGEVDEVQRQQGTSNQVPNPIDYDDDELCNASAYATDKLIEIATDVFGQKNSSNYAAWLQDKLFNGGGYIAGLLENVWESVNGSYASTVAELVAASPYVREILFDSKMEREQAVTAVLADTSISAAAKQIIAALIASLTDGQFQDWGFFGTQANSGGCIPTTSWQWSHTTMACVYGLPIGWTLNIGAASCGVSSGFQGIFRTRTNVAAEINAIINLAAPIQIDSVKVNALCNLGGGYTAGTLICTVNNGATEVFRNSRTMPLTGYVDHNFTPVVTGNQIVIYSVQNYSGVNPTGLAYKKISVNAALL
jgi:hypothetical protein